MPNPPSLLTNRRFLWMVILVTLTGLGILVVNIFVIGGDTVTFNINSNVNFPLATLAAISAIAIWVSLRKDSNNRILWSGFTLGWMLWALAEAIWSVYTTFGHEVPYPSIADIFWTAGYIPLGIGLIARVRSMPVKTNLRQNIFIVIITVLTILSAFFLVILPTLRDFNLQRLDESILNIIYPLGDLFLLVIVWRLFFSYETGDYSIGWMLITIGFILNAMADFIFTYATWHGLYYPEMKATLLSRFGVDVPYSLSYLLWLSGIITLWIQLKEETPFDLQTRIRQVRTYGNILIYTRNDDTILDMSANFGRLFDAEQAHGETLASAMGIPADAVQPFLEKMRREGKAAEHPVQVCDRDGKTLNASLSGIAILDPRHEYHGGNILLRLRTTATDFDAPLNSESRQMVRFVLENSGSRTQAEIGQFLADYYKVYIKSLLDMVFHQGGNAAVQALFDQMKDISNQHNWNIQFEPDTILDSSDIPLDILREALPILLDTARNFVKEITSPATVEARLQKVRAQFSDQVLRDVEYYRQDGHEVGFADHRQKLSRLR